jgi:hypothetical protein
METQMTTNLSVAALTKLSAQTGPCLTLLVPDHHPGTPDSSPRTHLRTLIKAGKQLTVANPKAVWPAGFENPIEELAASLPDVGGSGFAVYRTLDSVESVPLAGTSAKAILASHPYVMPLLTPAFAAHDLFVLGLSSKHLRLLEYVDGVCKQLSLPAGVPSNVEASHLRHGEQGENRTPAGSSAGKMAGVRFGTGGDRESAREAFEHYCVLIDQGLRPLLGDRPLLLMGVKEEIAAYRRVSHHHSLLHTEVDGNTETFTPAHIAQLAHAAALAEYQRLGEAVLAEIKEMRDRARTAIGPRDVLKAAAEGRVHQLVVRSGTELLAPMEDALNLAHLPTEDLINAAVVETLKNGGQVFLLPPELMPVTESASAILRY